MNDNTSKNVEIKGIGFPNRGAELLLVATLEQLQRRRLKAAMEPYSPYDFKVQYPLYTKACILVRGVNVLSPLGMLPNYARKRLGLLKPNEIDLALDASGYAYGDPWGAALANSRVLKDPSTAPLYLLPQSLGPFDTPAAKQVAQKIVKRAKSIYAREVTGADYLKDATGYEASVVPDITFGLHVPPSARNRDVIFIPNFQVLKRRGDKYVDLLTSLSADLSSKGRKVSMLNHEGSKDFAICEAVVNSLHARGFECELIQPKDGLEAKAIIGASKFVLTSRYHGLISALSQSIPVACLGWSYKYETALSLFDVPQLDIFENPQQLVEAVQADQYCDIFSSPKYIAELAHIRSQVEHMWDEILGEE